MPTAAPGRHGGFSCAAQVAVRHVSRQAVERGRFARPSLLPPHSMRSRLFVGHVDLDFLLAVGPYALSPEHDPIGIHEGGGSGRSSATPRDARDGARREVARARGHEVDRQQREGGAEALPAADRGPFPPRGTEPGTLTLITANQDQSQAGVDNEKTPENTDGAVLAGVGGMGDEGFEPPTPSV